MNNGYKKHVFICTKHRDDINKKSCGNIGSDLKIDLKAKIVQKKLNSNKIVTGYDGRLTSPALHEALCYGLKDSGAEVFDVGMGPTPMTYFAHYHLQANAAVMVTGSHNPSEYNGFKMVLNYKPFYSTRIKDLQKNIDLKNNLNLNFKNSI